MSTPTNHTGPTRPTGPSGDGLGLTTPLQAVVAALAGAVAGYFIIGTMRWAGSPVPVTPWSLPVVFVVLALAAVTYARRLRRQVVEARAAMAPEVGVLALVLGKTLLMTGAVMAGGHALYVATNLGSLDAPLPHARVVHGLVMVVASLACAAAGQHLEKACLVPPSDGADDDAPGGASR